MADPDALAHQLSARKFAEWAAYFQLEPFGPPADFWRAGAIRSTIVNVNRTKKTQKIATAEDFMPDTFTETPEQDTAAVGDQVAQAFRDLSEAGRKRTHG